MKKNLFPVVLWIILTAITSAVWFFRSESVIQIAFAIGGSLIGFVLPVFLDILLPRFMKNGVGVSSVTSDVFTEGIAQVKLGNVLSSEVPQTPLRSYPLLGCYLLVAFLVMSSAHGLFGKAFILGLGLSLVTDLFFSRRPIELLKKRWFSIFKANLTDKEYDYFIGIVLTIYIILVIVSLFV